MRTALPWVFLLLSGCAAIPPGEPPSLPAALPSEPSGHGSRIVAQAMRMIGMPYRFGGADPLSGFDCSGLVQFSFREAGFSVARSTDAQRQAARPVPRAELQPGDLLFFDLQGQRNSHVGIYAGDGSFVHAPSTGKNVRRDRLDAPFWRSRLSEIRRIPL